MRKIRVVLIIICTVFFFQNSYGQKSNNVNKEKTVKQTNKLVGTWRLIEYTDLDTLTHKWTYPYGKNPRGYFTYTSTNIVNLNISADNSLKLTEDSAKTFPMSYYNFIENYSFGYFGTYSINWQKSIVTHHVWKIR
ncbi:MAG: lipocalin-like domain-containing protein [Chitinophagaceae bacterium]|nr:lipocalin-like domain-containing protein [Chitinophagaceae bacterium]